MKLFFFVVFVLLRSLHCSLLLSFYPVVSLLGFWILKLTTATIKFYYSTIQQVTSLFKIILSFCTINTYYKLIIVKFI